MENKLTHQQNFFNIWQKIIECPVLRSYYNTLFFVDPDYSLRIFNLQKLDAYVPESIWQAHLDQLRKEFQFLLLQHYPESDGYFRSRDRSVFLEECLRFCYWYTLFYLMPRSKSFSLYFKWNAVQVPYLWAFYLLDFFRYGSLNLSPAPLQSTVCSAELSFAYTYRVYNPKETALFDVMALAASLNFYLPRKKNTHH